MDGYNASDYCISLKMLVKNYKHEQLQIEHQWQYIFDSFWSAPKLPHQHFMTNLIKSLKLYSKCCF